MSVKATLIKKQKALIKEIEELNSLVSLDYQNILEYDEVTLRGSELCIDFYNTKDLTIDIQTPAVLYKLRLLKPIRA